ncbi:MAG: transcription antitermination factor NusB [Desulfobacteraceae bacterium]|nr:MAG: transcription antitermination factor NusB [Desulfobacteraceae bacterium]
MGNRRKARELAMQALFYMDTREGDPGEMLDLYCRCFPIPKKSFPLFMKLVQGVMICRDRIDSIIESQSSNWKISRMPCVDRNVMRIAVYELICCEDIPAKVSINEAIDIGKKFGTDDSGAFINGILDSIRIGIDQGRILKSGSEFVFEKEPTEDETKALREEEEH